MRKVLVVDDEKSIVKGLKFSLEQDDMEVDTITHDAVGLDSYITEETILPVALNGTCDVLAGYGDALPLGQSREADKNKVIVGLHTFYGDISDIVFLRRALIIYHRIHNALLILGIKPSPRHPKAC